MIRLSPTLHLQRSVQHLGVRPSVCRTCQTIAGSEKTATRAMFLAVSMMQLDLVGSLESLVRLLGLQSLVDLKSNDGNGSQADQDENNNNTSWKHYGV